MGLSAVLVNTPVVMVPLLAVVLDRETLSRRFLLIRPVTCTLRTGGVFETGATGSSPAVHSGSHPTFGNPPAESIPRKTSRTSQEADRADPGQASDRPITDQLGARLSDDAGRPHGPPHQRSSGSELKCGEGVQMIFPPFPRHMLPPVNTGPMGLDPTT